MTELEKAASGLLYDANSDPALLEARAQKLQFTNAAAKAQIPHAAEDQQQERRQRDAVARRLTRKAVQETHARKQQNQRRKQQEHAQVLTQISAYQSAASQ